MCGLDLNMWCNPGLVLSTEPVWVLPLVLAPRLMNSGDQLQLLGATLGVTFFSFKLNVVCCNDKFIWKIKNKFAICLLFFLLHNDLIRNWYEILSYSFYLAPKYQYFWLTSTDVLDLAWSPNDSWLASCSIDNTIIVWNADNFPGMILCEHVLCIIY